METAKRIGIENEQVRISRQKKWILLGILVLLFISVMLSIAVIEVKKSKSKPLVLINPTEKNFTKTKTVSGRVVQSHAETIYLNAAKGSIQEIFVKEGETVTKGQKLFSYEGSTVAAELGQAEVNKKLAETSVTQMKEQITSLEQDIREAVSTTTPDTTNTTNTTDTTDTTNTTDAVDSANIATKAITIQSLQAELNKAKAELRTAELKVEKNTLQAEMLKAELETLTVISNTAGVISNLKQNVGQGFRAKENQQLAIMQIASNDPFQIEGKLTEVEKAKITSGQSITVTSKVVANKKWKGKIAEVSDYPTYKTTANKDKDTQQETIPYYSFKASLDSQKGLYPGYYTTLDVVVQSKQLLAVPETSIMGFGKSTYVYVQKKGKIQKQKVETGQNEGKWVAILTGLKEEDKLVENPSWIVRFGTSLFD
ncbi:efflux RND transporter periplasmic adaptor subunit [Bacillus sp. ISL-75]|uniref:efflux RND transporter periplasmic adaptor subunit n=1 Tax=Bacillus sp. ISL-75 TaxID=2819137 RepID=UPI001BEA5977|nr:efflux RND transporter periplasmic adaptor subunit [Bacillus sp. ISL-75]MBT2730554.1 efflux RND transporter periplasmic adaptor subunit [Bacillus sp. ISL-75]